MKNIDVTFDIKKISSTYQEALVLQVKKSLMPRIRLPGENAWHIFCFFGPIELNQFVAFVSFVSIVSFTAGILSVGMRGHQ